MNADIKRDETTALSQANTIGKQTSVDTAVLSVGLTSQEAKERLEQYGFNELKHRSSGSNFVIFARQFQSTVIALLLVAAVVSFLSREYVQAIAILSAVLINALIGFVTELKAKISLAALESLAAPTCRVLRDGSESQIAAKLLIPGDVVILDAGARVPADILITNRPH